MNYCLFIFFVFLNCIQISIQLKETNYNIEINVDQFVPEIGDKVGKKGVIALVGSCSTNIFNDDKDIEDNTKFETTISDENNKINFSTNCRFWRFSDSIYEVNIFCYLDETIPTGDYEININSTKLTYKEYNITILSNNKLSFSKEDYHIIQLYSDEQKITMENEKDSYELKFKINAYNNEKIYLYKKHNIKIALDNCNLENKELKCLISKTILDEITEKDGDRFGICYLNNKNSFDSFILVPNIKINYKDIKKEIIYVSITKLIENVADSDSYIAYETNVTDISKFSSDLEKISLEFSNGEEYDCGLNIMINLYY